MPCPEHGPCDPFVVEADLCCLSPSGTFPDPCLQGGQPLPPGAVDNAIAAASELLWAATGRQFGTCQVTLRPCKKTCDPCGLGTFFGIDDFGVGFGPPFFPVLHDGIWFNLNCGCTGVCGCTKLEEIDLPYPVCSIVEVLVDGVALPANAYRVDEFKKLVRLDGSAWPVCQNLALPTTDVGTWSVELIYGREVPALVQQATAEMACQFLKACVGAPCQLPQRISTVTRQGVTAGFLDTMEFLLAGHTGIYIVDLAIRTFNPKGLARKPGIWSPDAGPKWRITDTGT